MEWSARVGSRAGTREMRAAHLLRMPYERHRLKNGMEVILHPDTRLPRVAVNVLFRVGSRDDPRGRTGMAHLFEHLMFMGTRRVPENQFDLLMEEMGGSNNAFTTEDLTDYYDVGPSRILETLLWVEADRMATLARAMTRKKLEVQREVVLNELRQSYENAPYGKLHLALPGLLYSPGHPYSWPVIGSKDDLRSVTVEDTRRLFQRFYSPRNASLVVAGRFEVEGAMELVRRHFEHIPAERHAASRRTAAGSAKISRDIRQTFVDRVELPRLELVWHSPPTFAPGDADMDLASSVLAVGKQSRLHRALVYDLQLALDVDAHQDSRQLGSLFVIEITGRPGVERRAIERALEGVLARFLEKPPSARELERAKNGFETDFIGRLEQVSRRAELLNLYSATAGEPDYLEADLERYRRVTVESMHRHARRVVSRPRAVLWVEPGEDGPALVQEGG
jgi:predicted Zn-dependent peptidase